MKHLWKIVPILLACLVFCASQDQAQGELTDKTADFTLTSLDGEQVTLSKLKGNVVLLDFWATWCPPCRNSIPVFVKLYNKYHNQGFTVLGISLEDRAVLEKYRDAQGIPYPILLGNKEIAKAYEVQAIPKIFILDKSGKVRKTQVGFAPELESMFESLVDSLIRE